MASKWSKGSHLWYAKRVAEPPEAPPPPLGDLIRTWRVEDLDDEARTYQDQAQIRNPRTVNSFNWVGKRGGDPTILIPGKPPQWTPQAHPSRLKEDSGRSFRDKNAARYPKHPTEPAVVAALAADPTIPAEIDMFACGSTFGNLLRFVQGQDRPFRMLVYKLHTTVFLVRRENSPTELIPDVRGYGHAFPEANTTWEADVRGSVSHQRLVRYEFGGLDLVVRFEADGYLKPEVHKTDGRSPKHEFKPSTTSSSQHQSILNDLTSSLSSTTITPFLPNNNTSSIISTSTPSTNSKTPTDKIPLTITRAGELIPSTYLFDLKTRSIRTRQNVKSHPLTDQLPRLWVSQIPNFILAFHASGLFEPKDTEIRDVREDVARWEKENAKELARLAVLLRWVRREVSNSSQNDDGQVVEICHCLGGGEGAAGQGVLEVRRAGGDVGTVVSDAVGEWWMNAGGVINKGGGGGSNDAWQGKGGWSEEKEGEGGYDDGKGVGARKGSSGDTVEWDEGEDDFTGCGVACGYCGKCTY